ncbi:hypothetical protein ACFQZ8_01215, partial [Micromonospora azadirachtae]
GCRAGARRIRRWTGYESRAGVNARVAPHRPFPPAMPQREINPRERSRLRVGRPTEATGIGLPYWGVEDVDRSRVRRGDWSPIASMGGGG